MNTFWQVNIGNLISAASVILVLWGFHRDNKKKLQKGIEEFNDIKDKVNQMFTWYTTNATAIIEMKTKLTLMYDIWFKGGSETAGNEGD